MLLKKIITIVVILSTIIFTGCNNMKKPTGARLEPPFTINNAIYNWWINPIATRYTDQRDKTYFNYITSDGTTYAAAYDHKMKSLQRFALGSVVGDDHNCPCVLAPIRGTNDPIIIFWANHSASDNKVYYRKSLRHEDISAFDTTQEITYSDAVNYVQAYRYGTKIYLFSRLGGTTGSWVCRISNDNGNTWSDEIIVVDDGSNSMYMGTQQVYGENRIRIVLNDHPPTGTRHDVFIAEMDLINGNIYLPNAAKTVIGNIDGTNLPLSPDSFLKIYDANTGENTRLLSIGANPNLIEVIICSFTNTTDGVYKYITYDGATTTVKNIIAAGLPIEIPAGNNYYFAGADLVHNRIGNIYITREQLGEWILEKYITEDGGNTWQSIEIDRSNSDKVFRPISVSGSTGLLYIKGSYTTYTNWSTNLRVFKL